MTLSGMCADHRQALPPGHRVGQCRLLGVLGVGGFGVTYLGEHAGIGHRVAVKEYFPNEFAVRDGATVQPKSPADREGFEWGLSRFVDEARTLSRFRHPNLVRVSDCFKANNTAYIVMDYEDGEPLDVLLGRRGTLTEAQLRRVVLPIADGLRQVHAAGFLHRDVKPANIHIRRSDESPVLLDFGAARQSMSDKSRSMTVIASAGYSPPEQYAGQGAQGPWTDVYALSALCRRAMTGRPPMDAPSRQREMLRSQADPLPKLADAGIADYSPALLAAVDWGLRVVETERPQSLDEWLAQWEGGVAKAAKGGANSEGGKAPGRPGAGGAGRSGVRTAWLAGAAVVAIGVALHFALAHWPQIPAEGGAPLQRSTLLRAERGDATAQYDLGRMYDRGEGVAEDDREAARWFRKAAEQGHAKAQHRLGFMYATGEGVAEDDREAARWFRKAAEQGLAEAQNGLGRMYATGEGVAEDDREAVRWFRKAAEQGLAKAQYSLGVMHQYGGGVPKNGREAARWYRKAAEQGHAEAQLWLGVMHKIGEGVPKDFVQAYAWFNLAAAQGMELAEYARTALEAGMTQAQIAEAQQLSRQLAD